MFKLDLRLLIVLLGLAVGLVTFINAVLSSYQTERDLLMAQTLEANRVYAAKQAASTELFLLNTLEQLAYSAGRLAESWEDAAARMDEAERLSRLSRSFNAVTVHDRQGRIIATSSDGLAMLGLRSQGTVADDGHGQRSWVSQPFRGVNGELLVFLSYPVVDAAGQALGLVGGTLYLQQPNALHALLAEHYYRDGTHFYVVDRSRQLIYHSDAQRVGEQMVFHNPAVEAVLQGRAGMQRLINSRGIDMLAGYAPVPSAGWGVVAQRPTAQTLAELDELMLKTLRNSIPITLLSLLAIAWLARWIARPLRNLADTVEHWDSPTADEEVRRVRAWYFEAQQLQRAMQEGLAMLHDKLGRLSEENITDPLSGLLNRRGLALGLERLQQQRLPFAVLALDIDHFKQINDRHGHALGDRVLQHLAGLMRDCSRSTDLLCRSGGEEFLMLLPQADAAVAMRVAERLRLSMASMPSPTGTAVTVSLGVALWPGPPTPVAQVLKAADAALYEAKAQGRDRVVYAPTGEDSAAGS